MANILKITDETIKQAMDIVDEIIHDITDVIDEEEYYILPKNFDKSRYSIRRTYTSNLGNRITYPSFISFFQVFEDWYKENKSLPYALRLSALAYAILRGYRHVQEYWWIEHNQPTIEDVREFIPYVERRMKKKLPLFGVESFNGPIFAVRQLFGKGKDRFCVCQSDAEQPHNIFDIPEAKESGMYFPVVANTEEEALFLCAKKVFEGCPFYFKSDLWNDLDKEYCDF